MRKSALSFIIAGATMLALASALLSTTAADGETKTPDTVVLEGANWGAAGIKPPSPPSVPRRCPAGSRQVAAPGVARAAACAPAAR
jgi:hypothetical protein